MDRRNFLGLTLSSSTSMLISSLYDFSSSHKPIDMMQRNFDLKIMATNWGFPGSLDEYCSKAKQEGYDGIEIWWPEDQKGQDELFGALQKYNLEVGFLTAGHESNFRDHFASFTKMIGAAAHNRIKNPLYINCHSGRDYFSFEENSHFFEHTMELARETGIKICHETHRSRILYSAPVARNFMEKIPGLRMTLDISHWCNVHETLLQDQQETVNMALQRVDHIHARIGHPEGPQVNDPRAPEWSDALKAHFAWWDAVVKLKKEKGERLTILTEFGPPHYMPTIPYTMQPVADQWGINVHMMKILRERYL